MEPNPPGVSKLASAFRTGTAHPVPVLATCLQRIAAADGDIGAFTYLAAEEADAAARESEERLSAGRPRSELEGVPVAVKEIFDVAGWPSTAGSLLFEGRRADHDSALVARLRQAGAVLVGLTRTHEFAMGVTTQHETRGSTRNPWNPSRVPGGSSGGSAAAVAAGMVPLAVGSDTSGSVRIPAAFCGICGVRPTHGRLPLEGVTPLAPSYDTAGFLAREVEDLTLALAATDPGFTARIDLSWEGVRLGLPREPLLPLGSDQSTAFDRAVRTAEGLGAQVIEVSLPTADELAEALQLQIAEILHVHRTVLGTWPARAAEYGSSVRSRLEGMSRREPDAAAGRQAGERLRRRVAALPADVFLAPVATQGPSRVDDPEAGDYRDTTLRSNHLQAVLGAPAVAIPAGFDSDGLPVGVQLWGPRGADAEVLALSEGLVERHR